ncbi:tail assembly protein [Stenotrophomonas tuberculopleuritidis]|uniref:tail assembly protein n=1 Tax=Stenotrophomonas tuberculopleuritidis TaxID=3055079 RepID=UPI0026E52ECB|nr:tail assembly protein [Stenotrophomonas sp. 704A1]
MTERLRTIRLYGQLGSRFGRSFRLAVNSPAEAVHALCAILPGFQQYLTRAKENGMAFAVFVGKQNLTKDQLQDPPGQQDIRIAPVLLGSKRGGILNIILGVVLIVVGVWTQNYNLVIQGAVMVVGGVVQMLGPQPKGLGSQDSAENRPNYSMNGTVNTQAQGNPVPVAYGGHDQKGMLIGSAVISGGIMAEDQL